LRIPLYAGIKPLPERRPDFNTGLWYDKFFYYWRRDEWSVQEGQESGKIKWIKAASAFPVGDRALLEEAVRRITNLVLALRGEIRCFATDWRFVSGLGREHPVENGFAWHHTLGVPYLPGSAVKGVVRSWVQNWKACVSLDDIRRVFGPDDKEERDIYVGSVIFFDALPVNPVKLEAEVMTPHYAPYYQQDSPEKPPGDWYDPVPIPFLTVAPGQTFLFGLAPRRVDEQSRLDCLRAIEWLTEALAGIGAGAKTGAGYGRFVRQARTETVIRSQAEKT